MQAIFDKIVNHLLSQNKRSVRHHSYDAQQCAYRGNDGLKCAIGCLIEDDNYSSELESLSVNTYAVKYALIKSGINTESHTLMSMLGFCQNMHDSNPPDTWMNSLKSVAEQFNLKFNYSY